MHRPLVANRKTIWSTDEYSVWKLKGLVQNLSAYKLAKISQTYFIVLVLENKIVRHTFDIQIVGLSCSHISTPMPMTERMCVDCVCKWTPVSLHRTYLSRYISYSVTKMGDFEKSEWQSFLKSSQNLWWLFGFKWKASFFSKSTLAPFWATFIKTWATFSFNIWSHWDSYLFEI